MKLIPVEDIPNMKGRHHLQNIIEEFANGDTKTVKVELGEHEYKSAKICYSCLGVAIKKSGHPIKAVYRNGEVFLSKV